MNTSGKNRLNLSAILEPPPERVVQFDLLDLQSAKRAGASWGLFYGAIGGMLAAFELMHYFQKL